VLHKLSWNQVTNFHQIILAYIKDLSYISFKINRELFDVISYHRILTERIASYIREHELVFNRVAKERHGRSGYFIDHDRAFRYVSLPKFSSSSCLIRRLICPAWKLSRLRRAGVCLTELSGTYDRSFKGPDTAKAYRFRGNAKSTFSTRCDFRPFWSRLLGDCFLCISLCDLSI